MRKLVFFLCAFAVFFSCEKFQNEVTGSNMSLNGTWNFYASNEVSETDVVTQKINNWDTLQVPGNWDTRARYSEYVGKGYYKKEFTIPKHWQNKQIWLKFDAVYETAKVWLNGKLLGKHIGGYTPFEFNITNNVNLNEANTIVVMANNTYKRGAWWAWGGISRNVSLSAKNNVRIVYQHITSEPDFEANKVNFIIKYKLDNSSNEPVSIKINSNIENIHTDSLFITIEKNAEAISYIKFQKPLSQVKLWHFNHPNLYQLQSNISNNNNLLDTATDKFGIRKFEVRGEQFFLNNKAVRMNGVNRVHDHPVYGNTEPDHLVKQDMLDIKYNLGCNFSRLMHAPLSKNILKLCDSIGFLLVEEIPVWGDGDPNSVPNNPQTKQWMQEMIERDYNHPSVVAWSVGNELRTEAPKWGEQHLTKKQYDYVNEMINFTESLDKTRLKTYVSNTAYQGGEIGTEPYEKLDFLSINSYGHAIKIIEKVHKKFPNKPIFVSEIGRGQIGPAPHAKLKDDLIEFISQLKNYPYVTGVSIWSYNDYRSNYKGTPDSGFREWGIVDENRNKKEAYNQLKNVYKTWKN